MKIAVYHNQPSGGARRALFELSAQLARRHTIDVVTLETADETFLASNAHARNVTVLPYRRRKPLRGAFYLNELREVLDLRDLEAVCRSAAGRIDAGGYDVALVDVCRFMQAPSVLAFLRTPSLHYCHEPPRRFLEAHCRPGASPRTSYQRMRALVHVPARAAYDKYAQRLDRRNFLSASAVVTNSLHTQRIIRDYYHRDADVCYLGVNARCFRPAGGTQGDYVLAVGALEPHKGYDFLIESLARCPDTIRPRLVIVGNTDDSGVGSRLQHLARTANVRLDVIAKAGHAELLDLYQQARAFVFAAHQEPFGLVLLEAMACGLPIVSVNEGGPAEIIEDGVTGLLVPRDESDFASAVVRVLEDSALSRSLAQAARREVEQRWTWEAAAERLEKHLHQLANQTSEGAA